MANFIFEKSQEVAIKLEQLTLYGNLMLPKTASAIVVFAHGSGSGRLSPRNQAVAHYLNQQGFATLLFDLLTEDEDVVDAQTREYRFNIPLLAERLVAVTDWLKAQTQLSILSIGYFGASTGAGAALIAAAERPAVVDAVVSRGGRPDLAEEALARVKAPTLLIVGGLDDVVIELNQQALAALACESKLDIVPDATHLFEEPGKLDEVMVLVGQWFQKYLL